MTFTPDQFNQFFLVVSPGLEELAFDELSEVLRDQEELMNKIKIEKSHGGIELFCPLSLGLSLNYSLSLPEKIYLRLDEFICRDSPKLFNKAQKFCWHQIFFDLNFSIQAYAAKSRFGHTGRIEETLSKAIFKAKEHNPRKKFKAEVDPNFSYKILVNIQEDNLSLSYDTSGELLHLRGNKPFNGRAPLRATKCSAILRLCDKYLPQEPLEILDPFAGSGTFAMEMFPPSKSPRTYSFENTLLPRPKYRARRSFKGREFRVTLMEKDPLIFKGLCQNIETLGEKKQELDLLNECALSSSFKFSGTHSLLLSNPPYNLRVKTDQGRKFLKDLSTRVLELQPKYLGLVLPETQWASLKKLLKKDYLEREVLNFSHGGISVEFRLLTRA